MCIIVSATLTGVEALKYPPFYGIFFFVEIFSIFSLVSDFFSKWHFSKNGFLLLVLRYWFIYILFYNPRRRKMARSNEKAGGCSRSSCPFTCLMIDHTTAQIEVVRKSLYAVASYRGITIFTQQYICIWAGKNTQWL